MGALSTVRGPGGERPWLMAHRLWSTGLGPRSKTTRRRSTEQHPRLSSREPKRPHECPWPIDHAHGRLGQFQRSRFPAESPSTKFAAASESGRRPMAHGPISSRRGGVATGTGDLCRPIQCRLASTEQRTQDAKSNPGRTTRTCNQCRYGNKNGVIISANRCLITGPHTLPISEEIVRPDDAAPHV